MLQFDIHQPFTTVKEALQFSAWLRFGTDTSSETMEQFITEVMNLVELDSLEKALVGRPGQSGLSVEQRKRLTIAVELVANPSIVFMDEPTSGAPLLLLQHHRCLYKSLFVELKAASAMGQVFAGYCIDLDPLIKLRPTTDS